MLDKSEGEGVILKVYTQPRASVTKIIGEHDGMLKVACCAPPVDGRANKELLTFLASTFRCPKRDIVLTHGHSSRKKRFECKSLNRQDVEAVLKEQGLV